MEGSTPSHLRATVDGVPQFRAAGDVGVVGPQGGAERFHGRAAGPGGQVGDDLGVPGQPGPPGRQLTLRPHPDRPEHGDPGPGGGVVVPVGQIDIEVGVAVLDPFPDRVGHPRRQGVQVGLVGGGPVQVGARRQRQRRRHRSRRRPGSPASAGSAGRSVRGVWWCQLREWVAGGVGVVVPRLVTSGGGHRLVVGRGGQREQRGEVGGLPPRELLGDEPQARAPGRAASRRRSTRNEPATGPGVDIARRPPGVDPGERRRRRRNARAGPRSCSTIADSALSRPGRRERRSGEIRVTCGAGTSPETGVWLWRRAPTGG